MAQSSENISCCDIHSRKSCLRSTAELQANEKLLSGSTPVSVKADRLQSGDPVETGYSEPLARRDRWVLTQDGGSGSSSTNDAREGLRLQRNVTK